MALVAYNDSDFSDSENEQTEVKLNVSTTKSEELFDSLPTPKTADEWTSNAEEDDEFLKKKEVPVEKPPPKSDSNKNAKRKPAQIFLPSLSSFNDDDDIDSPPKFKKSTKGSGLLNMLPQPKADMFIKKPSTSFIPNALNKAVPKPLSSKTTVKLASKNIKKTQSNTLITNYSSSEGSDISDSEDKSADFFSLNAKPNLTDVPTDVKDLSTEIIPTPSISNSISEPNAEYYQEYINEYKSEDAPSYSDETPEDMRITDEALIKLASSRERHVGDSIQIIDINQSEIMPDSREWLTKALTENAPTQVTIGKRSGGDFTSQQRRKHQITYLASQARANEQALQNQWANNRLTRKQTQSKYGF